MINNFESVKDSARTFNVEASNIFNAISRKTLFQSTYKISYDKNDQYFVEDIIHQNKIVMKNNKNNKNANKYE